MHFLGIDWADEKHDVCLLSPDGRILSQFIISNDLYGFQKLDDRLSKLDGLKVNVERSDGLLVDWLVGQGHDLYITPPSVLHHRRPRRSKDDKGDAYLLAQLLHSQDPEARPLAVHSPTVYHLRQLLQAYDGVLREQRRLGNQFIHLLKAYYPAALRAFSVPHRLITLAFVERFPTPEAARAATLEDLHDFLKAQRYHYLDTKLPQLYSLLQQPAPTARMYLGMMEHVNVLIPQLRHLCHSRAQLEKRVLEVFATHPEAGWWKRLPGAGPLTAPRLLAWIGDNRDRFPTPEVLQAIAGTVPVTRRSGKQHSVEFRAACCHPLRSAMDDFARLSVKKSGWASAYYREQRGRGRKSARAYRALANRWLNIIWKLWQTGEVYDENIHVANRSRRGITTMSEQRAI
jgi:transposase